METVKEVCQYIGKTLAINPVCIETGCSYIASPENLIHTTTNNISEYVVLPLEGDFYSLDIDPTHIEFAKTLCSEGVAPVFMLGDSVKSLSLLAAKVDRVDLLCLDSKEFDEDHMVNEFDAIKEKLSKKHFILVDDIHNDNSVKYKKMVPLLKKLDYNYMEISTPTGMFFATKGYLLPK